MEKQPYIVPEIETLDIQIENGFAQSDGNQMQNIPAVGIGEWDNGEF